MRRGIADLHRRAEVSEASNRRLADALAAVDDSRTIEELTAGIQQPVTWQGRRVRVLRPWGEDYELLRAVNHGEFVLNGLRNRDAESVVRPACGHVGRTAETLGGDKPEIANAASAPVDPESFNVTCPPNRHTGWNTDSAKWPAMQLPARVSIGVGS
jgi:hypothetical protein